jgi:hypothetical protein
MAMLIVSAAADINLNESYVLVSVTTESGKPVKMLKTANFKLHLLAGAQPPDTVLPVSITSTTEGPDGFYRLCLPAGFGSEHFIFAVGVNGPVRKSGGTPDHGQTVAEVTGP